MLGIVVVTAALAACGSSDQVGTRVSLLPHIATTTKAWNWTSACRVGPHGPAGCEAAGPELGSAQLAGNEWNLGGSPNTGSLDMSINSSGGLEVTGDFASAPPCTDPGCIAPQANTWVRGYPSVLYGIDQCHAPTSPTPSAASVTPHQARLHPDQPDGQHDVRDTEVTGDLRHRVRPLAQRLGHQDALPDGRNPRSHGVDGPRRAVTAARQLQGRRGLHAVCGERQRRLGQGRLVGLRQQRVRERAHRTIRRDCVGRPRRGARRQGRRDHRRPQCPCSQALARCSRTGTAGATSPPPTGSTRSRSAWSSDRTTRTRTVRDRPTSRCTCGPSASGSGPASRQLGADVADRTRRRVKRDRGSLRRDALDPKARAAAYPSVVVAAKGHGQLRGRVRAAPFTCLRGRVFRSSSAPRSIPRP